MRLKLPVAAAVVVTLTACAQAGQSPTPTTDDDKALYLLGVAISQQVRPFDFTDKEIALVKSGVDDGARGKEKIDMKEMEKFAPKLDELYQARIAAALTREKEAGAAYLTKAATEAGATKLPSGIVYKTTTEGTGATPVAADTVKVHYEGRFTDGKVFDSSIERGEPAEFPLEGVIGCWTEGVQQMKVGGKATLVCPPDMAYGDEGRPPQMRGGATLVFDVELLEIVKPEAAAAAAPTP